MQEYIKLTIKKSNNEILINFDKITHIENKGKYSRITLDKFATPFLDVNESLENIETEILNKL